jgi:rhodanese-related sulfurtransferase
MKSLSNAGFMPRFRQRLLSPSASFVALLLTLAVSSALAIEPDQVPDNKRSASGLHLTAVEAAAMKQANPGRVLLIDIRTRAEAMYVGMPTLADHLVPVLDFPEMWEWSEAQGEYLQQGNPNFVKDIEQRLQQAGLTKDDAVILICRSGVRSNSASGLLSHFGFKKAYTVIDGFEGDTAKSGPDKGQRTVNGWKNAKLPWSYKLDTKKMYHDPL